MSEDRDSPPWERAGQRPAATGAPWERQAPEMNVPAMFRRAQPGEGMSFPPPKPGDVSGPATAEWSPGKYLGGSMESLVGAGKDIAKGTGNLVGNFFKWLSLPPTQERAQARGEFFGQLGDIGTFASGGLTGGLGIPGGRPAPGAVSDVVNPGLTRPLGIGPRPPEPPRPQLALPPPRETPMPPPPGGTAPPPGAPPQPGPPTAGPRITRPEVGPVPQTALRPDPTVPPLVRPGAEAGQPSNFASAIANNDASAIDKGLVRRYRGVVNPAMPPGQRNLAGLSQQDQRITTAVDTLIEGKGQLRLRDSVGNDVPSGQLPRSLDQFVQAIDQQKNRIFEDYDTLARGQGVRVPLGSTINELRRLANEPQVRDSHPNVAAAAESWAARLEEQGSYSPKEMQNVIQDMNAQLRNLLKGQATRETFSDSTLRASVLSTMRQTLNDTMNAALGSPQYQVLRNRYSALTSIEGDVANALRKEMARQPGGLVHTLSSPLFWMNAIHGVVTMDPGAIGRAAAIRGGEEITKRLMSPNRAVTRLFAKREADLVPPPPPLGPYLSSQIASRLPNPPPLPPQPYVGPSGM